MNTQDVEITDAEVNAIRNVCNYLQKIDDLPDSIRLDYGLALMWANDVIIGDDVPF